MFSVGKLAENVLVPKTSAVWPGGLLHLQVKELQSPAPVGDRHNFLNCLKSLKNLNLLLNNRSFLRCHVGKRFCALCVKDSLPCFLIACILCAFLKTRVRKKNAKYGKMLNMEHCDTLEHCMEHLGTPMELCNTLVFCNLSVQTTLLHLSPVNSDKCSLCKESEKVKKGYAGGY